MLLQMTFKSNSATYLGPDLHIQCRFTYIMVTHQLNICWGSIYFFIPPLTEGSCTKSHADLQSLICLLVFLTYCWAIWIHGILFLWSKSQRIKAVHNGAYKGFSSFRVPPHCSGTIVFNFLPLHSYLLLVVDAVKLEGSLLAAFLFASGSLCCIEDIPLSQQAPHP